MMYLEKLVFFYINTLSRGLTVLLFWLIDFMWKNINLSREPPLKHNDMSLYYFYMKEQKFLLQILSLYAPQNST
jgi:hypothetical protein